MTKSIFVIGSLSGSGKGILSASTCLLMKQRNFNVQYLKLDGFLNINCGVISPDGLTGHGECYVLQGKNKDGNKCKIIECDLDLGHIERMTGLTLDDDSICTSGMLFKELIEEQEEGKYLGKTITINPFLTDKIIQRIDRINKNCDISVIEVGGSLMDLEQLSFLEAICQYRQKHKQNTLVVLLSPVLFVNSTQEFKTKLLQRSVRDLQASGIFPDIIVARSEQPVPDKIIEKISDATNVPLDSIFSGVDCESVYEVPIQFYKQGYDDAIVDKLHMKRNPCRLSKYRDLVELYMTRKDLPEIIVGIVVKYKNCIEAYLSIKEAIYHASLHLNVKSSIRWIQTEDLEKAEDCDIPKYFNGLSACVIGPGFDKRGFTEKLKAAEFLRTGKYKSYGSGNQIPTLGICWGFQIAAVEIARHLCGLDDANSMECDKHTKHPVIHYLEGQENIKNKVSTMRLGSFECKVVDKNSILANLIKPHNSIDIRHRHRLEFNSDGYKNIFEEIGYKITGINPETNLAEVMELTTDKSHPNHHPYYFSLQGHPEYSSQLMHPSPFFTGLIEAALKHKEEKEVILA